MEAKEQEEEIPQNSLADKMKDVKEDDVGEVIFPVNFVNSSDQKFVDEKTISNKDSVSSYFTSHVSNDEKDSDSVLQCPEKDPSSELKDEHDKAINQKGQQIDVCGNTVQNETIAVSRFYESNEITETDNDLLFEKLEKLDKSCVDGCERLKMVAKDKDTLPYKSGSGEYAHVESSMDDMVVEEHLEKEKEEMNVLRTENEVLKAEIENLKISLSEVQREKQNSLSVQYENEEQHKRENERSQGTVSLQENTLIFAIDSFESSSISRSEVFKPESYSLEKNDETESNIEEEGFENQCTETLNIPSKIPNHIDEINELITSTVELKQQSSQEETLKTENVSRNCANEDIHVCQKIEDAESNITNIDLETTEHAEVVPLGPIIVNCDVLDMEEECIQQSQGEVEIISPKRSDSVKRNNHKSELGETDVDDGAKEGQKPCSRAYPFKVLVSGLPLSARREDVLFYFSQFGEVLKIYDEGRHRANVLYADEESFKNAVLAPDPYFDDHKLLIRSVNETTVVISGIPRCIPLKDAEKAVKDMFEQAGVHPCRITLPLSDPATSTEQNVLQGHAFVALCDTQALQNAEAKQKEEGFIYTITCSPVKLHPSTTHFYEQFCIRVFSLPPEYPRSVVYHNVKAAFAHIGEIIGLFCQYVGNAAAFAVYVLFDSEDAVKRAKEMQDLKILGNFVEVQEFHPFEQGQGFCHLWLKILNLPSRVTITEIKHHFGHDRGILNVQLDLDFGSCFMQVDSEAAMQRCLQMHQTYFRGKCIAIMIAEDHPDRMFYRETGRRGGRRPNYRNNSGRKKSLPNSTNSNFSGKTFTSATQPQGNPDRKGFERGDRKFSKSRSNQSKESSKTVKGDGDGVKIMET